MHTKKYFISPHNTVFSRTISLVRGVDFFFSNYDVDHDLFCRFFLPFFNHVLRCKCGDWGYKRDTTHTNYEISIIRKKIKTFFCWTQRNLKKLKAKNILHMWLQCVLNNILHKRGLVFKKKLYYNLIRLVHYSQLIWNFYQSVEEKKWI